MEILKSKILRTLVALTKLHRIIPESLDKKLKPHVSRGINQFGPKTTSQGTITFFNVIK